VRRRSGSKGEATLTAAFDDSLVPGAVYLPFNLGVSVGTGAAVTVEAVS
jgi:hypothetical protein